MRENFRFLFLLLALPMGLVSCKNDASDIDLSADLINTNDLIKEIIEEIQLNYADNVAREKLEIGAINGMLAVLDEHSLYITNSDINAYNQTVQGAILGIGIRLEQNKEGAEVISVIDDSPAYNAGIMARDVILKIQDKDVKTMKFKEIVSRLSSDTALNVKMQISRNKGEPFTIEVKKSVIQLRSVKLDFIEDIAIIKITYFNNRTLFDVSQAIKKINKKKSVGVIIDLRNNPGGILDQAVGVSDLFLSNKKIVEMKSRNVNESKTILSDDTDLLNGTPLVVLINSSTASGAELVASALGENKRAILIGEKTFGKGSQQTIIPIPKRGAIKLTTAYFLSPNGNMIDHKGVNPDIEIPQNTPQNTPPVNIPESKENAEEEEAVDPMVLRAVDLLHGLTVLSESSEGDT